MRSIKPAACIEMFDATPGTVYLIRPDGHVLARWRNGNAPAMLHLLTTMLASE